jgi:DNA-directed RNA polymerase subunit beta
VLLKALGWTNEEILEELRRLRVDAADAREGQRPSDQDEALLDIYRKLRPGEPPTKEAAQTLLDNLLLQPKRYDLAKVGRYKINKKLGLDGEPSPSTLTDRRHRRHDQVHRALHAGRPCPGATGERRDPVETDDIDHFGNRRLRTVGELIQNQIRTGLSRMERVVRERMTTQDVEAITPQTLINIRPVVAAIKEFFGTSSCRSSWTRTTRCRA